MFSTAIIGPDPAPEDAADQSPVWCFQRDDPNPSNTALEYPEISKQELAETNTWRALRRQLRFPWLESKAPDDVYPGTFRQVASLKPPEAKILERYVPQPGHWEEVDSPSLKQYIADACEIASRPRTPYHTIFVRRPFSPVDQIVKPVLREYQFSILPPPNSEEILEGNSEWIRKWEKNDSSRLACVNLEKCFLNSHRGLSLIRQLLDWLWKTDKTCVLVCSSWAFNEAEPPHLPVIVSSQIGPQPKAPPSDLLTQIAHYTRGNPWLAWKIWRPILQPYFRFSA